MSSTTTGLYTQCPLSFRIFAFIFTCLHKQNVSVVCCCCCCCCWVSSASAAAAVILLLVFERSSSALPPLPPPRPREEEEEEEEERKFLAARRIVLFCCCVRSFFEERFSSIFPSLSFPTKKNKNEQKKLQGWNYSFFFFSHHLCCFFFCFCFCFCSPSPLSNLSPLVFFIRREQRRRRIKRNWILHRKKTESAHGHAFTPIRSKTSTERVVRDMLEAILLVRRK